MLAFHCIQEALALGFPQLFHIPGNEITPYLHTLLFWRRDTSDIPTKGSVN